MSVKEIDVFPSAAVLATEVDAARAALERVLSPAVIAVLERYLQARDVLLMQRIGEELKQGRYAKRLDGQGGVEELVYFRAGP